MSPADPPDRSEVATTVDRDLIADLVRRSTAACGVPERLEDPGTAALIAEILDPDGRLIDKRGRVGPGSS